MEDFHQLREETDQASGSYVHLSHKQHHDIHEHPSGITVGGCAPIPIPIPGSMADCCAIKSDDINVKVTASNIDRIVLYIVLILWA